MRQECNYELFVEVAVQESRKKSRLEKKLTIKFLALFKHCCTASAGATPPAPLPPISSHTSPTWQLHFAVTFSHGLIVG